MDMYSNDVTVYVSRVTLAGQNGQLCSITRNGVNYRERTVGYCHPWQMTLPLVLPASIKGTLICRGTRYL